MSSTVGAVLLALLVWLVALVVLAARPAGTGAPPAAPAHQEAVAPPVPLDPCASGACG